jgi:AcrR family transcriptional regulator
MIELVAERGYERVTVRDLTSRAQISREALYRHFKSKRDSFLDTYELIVRRGARRALAAHQRATTWPERVRLGIGALVDEFAQQPRAAHLALVDCYSAWPESLERMVHTSGLFEALLIEGAAAAPERSVSVPPPLAKAIVAGVAGVVRERLLTGRAEELGELREELVEWSLGLLSGEDGWPERLYAPAGLEPSAAIDAPTSIATLEAGGERSLLLFAAVQLAAEKGFEELSVPHIRAAAGVSRRSFDAHFEDATDCFLEAILTYSGAALGAAAQAGARRETWRSGICETMATFCALLAADERLAKLAFVEVFAAGPAGVRCRARHVAELAVCLGASAPSAERPNPVAAEASVAAIGELIYEQIASGQAARLPEIAGTLAFCALAPAIGAKAAAETIRAEHSAGSPDLCSDRGSSAAPNLRG